MSSHSLAIVVTVLLLNCLQCVVGMKNYVMGAAKGKF